MGGFLSGGVGVIGGNFLEDGFGFGGLPVVEQGEAVEVEVGRGVDERSIVGFVHFLQRAGRVLLADEGGAGEKDFAFGGFGCGGGEVFEIFFDRGGIDDRGGEFHLFGGEERAQSESELRAVRVGGGHFFPRGNGGSEGHLPFFLLLRSEGAVATELLRGGAVEVGNFQHGLWCLRCGGVFLGELLVSGDGSVEVAAVGLGLPDAVIGEEDFVIVGVFLDECVHEADDLVGVLCGAGELGPLEVGEGRGLALREFFGDFGHGGDGFVVAPEGELGRGRGIHRTRGQLGLRIFLDKGIEERERALVVAFLLRADGDPEFRLLDLRGLREFGDDFFVGADGVIPLALFFEHIADADLGHGTDFGRRVGGEEIAIGFQRAVEIALLGAGGGFVDHGQSEKRTFRINVCCFFEILRGFLRVADFRIRVGEEEVAQGDG